MNKSTYKILPVLLILAFSLTFNFVQTATVEAQQPQPTPSADEVNAIAKYIYCPVCENTPLDVCPTDVCRQWRDLIRTQLAQGYTREQIEQYFVDNYGARVLAEPPREGLFWLVYIVPPVAIGLGVFILVRSFFAWRKLADDNQDDEPEVTDIAIDDDYVTRLEKELRNRD